jgi:hypothetical protein
MDANNEKLAKNVTTAEKENEKNSRHRDKAIVYIRSLPLHRCSDAQQRRKERKEKKRKSRTDESALAHIPNQL